MNKGGLTRPLRALQFKIEIMDRLNIGMANE